MIAVFKRELASYFKSLSGYVFGAFLLFFAGIYCMVYNLQSAYTNFEYVLGGMSFVFLVIIPVLTMRVLAEERRQKTAQLLYSLPISMTQVVLGKYAAMLVILMIPLAIVSLYPIILTAYGNVYLPAAFGAIAGFFFLGAALIAIGMYISSVTDSQAVAAGLCFLVMLVNYFISDLASYASSTAYGSLIAVVIIFGIVSVIVYFMTKSSFAALICAAVLEAATMLVYLFNSAAFEGLFPSIMEELSLFERFYTLLSGVFDLTSIVYFISVAGVFLFLSVQSMEKGRWNS